MLSRSAVLHFPAAAAQPRLHSFLGPVPSTSHGWSLSIQRRTVMAASSNGSGATATADASTSVEHAARLYELVRDMGVGAEPSEEVKAQLDNLIEQIEQQPVSRPLEDEAIFDDWQVTYVSIAKAPRQEGQPAGGRFRGRIGRLLFRLTELCQSTMQPNNITNKLGFTLLGLVRGSVGLRGTFAPVGDNADTVKVSFQPPVISLGNNVHLRIGPSSSVVLTTTWLDGNMRLGRGSRGSRFVFLRGGYARAAGMDQIGLQSTTTGGYAALFATVASLVGGTATLAASTSPVARVLAVVLGLLAGAISFVVFRGGQFTDPNDPVQKPNNLQESAKES